MVSVFVVIKHLRHYIWCVYISLANGLQQHLPFVICAHQNHSLLVVSFGLILQRSLNYECMLFNLSDVTVFKIRLIYNTLISKNISIIIRVKHIVTPNNNQKHISYICENLEKLPIFKRVQCGTGYLKVNHQKRTRVKNPTNYRISSKMYRHQAT